MQNLNNVNEETKVYQVANRKGIKPTPSKFSRFVSKVWTIILILLLVYAGYSIIWDHVKVQKQIDANLKAIQNSQEMQEYRAKEARKQREMAKQKRLRQLGIDGISEPIQKNDLLNEQLKKQEIAESQAPKKPQQTMDYRQKLEIYRQAQEGKNQRQ